jgi:hypothetical protein
MTEYDKKGKCKKLDRFQREKVMQIFDIITKEPASRMLVQLDASLAVKKLGDFVNVSADLSPLEASGAERDMSRGKRPRTVSLHSLYSIMK